MVGIDATLEEIENILLNDQWGSVYAFLVNEGGETIFHPLLRPSTEVRKSPYVQDLICLVCFVRVLCYSCWKFWLKSGRSYSNIVSSFIFTISLLEYQENKSSKNSKNVFFFK